MIRPKHCTNLKSKKEHWQAFCDLLWDQLDYGGDKYSCSDKRETTDLITEEFGVEWILGTCKKYLSRFRVKQREKDLLKVAAYMYIAWLQMGFHKTEEHDTDTHNEEKA
jgi:hypothetical protein